MSFWIKNINQRNSISDIFIICPQKKSKQIKIKYAHLMLLLYLLSEIELLKEKILKKWARILFLARKRAERVIDHFQHKE